MIFMLNKNNKTEIWSVRPVLCSLVNIHLPLKATDFFDIRKRGWLCFKWQSTNINIFNWSGHLTDIEKLGSALCNFEWWHYFVFIIEIMFNLLLKYLIYWSLQWLWPMPVVLKYCFYREKCESLFSSFQ